MIMITNPPDGSTHPAGTTITLQGSNGPPNRCVITCGNTTNDFRVGTGMGEIPLAGSMPGGMWGLPVPLPNLTGDCVIFVFSQSDKSGGITYKLVGRPQPGPRPPEPAPPA